MRLPAHRRLYQARALGALLVRYDRSAGWLARELGVTRQALSAWMTGRVVLPPYQIVRIAAVLSLTDAEVVVLLTSAALIDWERRGGLSSGRPDPYLRR